MSGSGRTWAGVATFAVIGVIGVGAALLYVNQKGGSKESAPAAAETVDPQLAAFAKGSLAALQTPASQDAFQAVSGYVFKNADGGDVRLADFAGKVTVVNLWATWCAPCKLEMPALNALQGAKGGKDFEVLAINMDSRDAGKPREWLKDNKIDHLAYYADTPGKIFQALRGAGRASGLPVTLLINRDGCLVGALDGAAEWHSEDAKALIKGAVGG